MLARVRLVHAVISNVLEALGFGFFTLAAYELGGRIAAFITVGVILLFVGFVLDGVRIKFPSLKLPSWRKDPEKRKLRMVDEPLTNRELDLLEQARD